MKLFRRGSILPVLLAIAAIIVLLFPDLVRFPQGPRNLDNSWIWSLAYAKERHFQWGVDYVFTYGPLGFLDRPEYYGSHLLWAIAAAFTLLCMAAMLLVLVKASRENGGRAWSFTLACEFVFCAMLTKVFFDGNDPQSAMLLSAFGLLVLSLAQGSSACRALLVAFLLALSAQIKATALIAGSALAVANLAACFVLQDRKKMAHACMTAAAFPLLWLLMWIASGQALVHMPVYLHGVFELADGYGKIMARTSYAYEVVIALLMIGIYLGGTGLGWRRNRVYFALFLITAPLLFLYWKEGFVRQDPYIWRGHPMSFFTVALYIFWIHYLAVKNRVTPARNVFLGGAIACMALLLICEPAGAYPWNLKAAGVNVQSALEAGFFDDHDAAMEKISDDLRASYDLPPGITSLLRPAPTLFLTWDFVVAPAYHVPLALLPVPQMYSVYTSWLDHLQTAWLTKNQPGQILYEYGAMDGHYPLFDGPEFSYHVLRQYTVVARTDEYAVMQRNPAADPEIKWQGVLQTCSLDREIVLPETGTNQHLLMKVGLKRSLPGGICGFFYKTAIPTILFHLKDGTTRSFSFVYTTGEDGLLVSHYVNNLDQYARLNQLAWPANVHSVMFSVDKKHMWQFASSFSVEFGTSTLSK